VSDSFTPTGRTRVVREPHRGLYDRDAIYKILDEAIICHVGFSLDGQPYAIPTLCARIGDSLYFHGSAASRMLRAASDGVPVCVTVTLLDGLVLARSIFNQSVNYRSAMALGQAENIESPEEKLAALHAFAEKVLPGRWMEVRQPSDRELNATRILRLPLAEISGKVRTGPPQDDAPDYALPVWAGVIPLRLVADPPVPDDRCDPALPIPACVTRLPVVPGSGRP
jgi:nitroimidazol reductase NimA-like FMN-containing flavoprotein (pyridoxamine 5'-phosphate oxidase superfamily)